jgi:uncharacterized phage protein (TIGR02220 family)
MSKEQKGFIVYGNIEESLNEMTDEQVAKLFRGMVSYFNTGKEPKFNGLMKMIFIPIRQQMDRDTDKYEKKCEKNRESIQRYWDKVKADTNEYERIRTNTNVANINTKTNANTKTDTETTTTSSGTDAGLLSFDLIQYLNEKTGSSYKADKTNAVRVQSLLDAGYTPLDLRTVIDKKCTEWMNDEKMRPYLRPSTLFGDKFGEYLSAPISIAQEKEQTAANKRKSLNKELKEKKQALDSLKDSLKTADKTERRILREQIAILEDSIGLIEGRLS